MMDTREFVMFLKRQLLEKANQYNEILYNVSYKNMEEGNRIAGIRTTLVSIANSLNDLLKEFHEERND